uniref:Uncharacterized protein n=1 Tax=Anguilla anguilla TaxID=7936 RepID=A0A0E9XZP6_ANGAN
MPGFFVAVFGSVRLIRPRGPILPLV